VIMPAELQLQLCHPLCSTSMAFTRVYSSSFSFLSAVTRCRHDVFLSFRGEDTRHNITPQLHRALEAAGIPTFKDDVNLHKGGEIASELLKAIQMSRIAVIVFSRNYANSGWCLDELVKIVECKNQAGQLLLPIFYDVDPLDPGSFAKAFATHEERFRGGNLAESKLEKWRAALTEAATLSQGWDLQNVASWYFFINFHGYLYFPLFAGAKLVVRSFILQKI
jgi:hypothetical protein